MTQTEVATRRLFDNDALNVRNLSVFPGSAREVSAEQLAGQINKALSQLEAGELEPVHLS